MRLYLYGNVMLIRNSLFKRSFASAKVRKKEVMRLKKNKKVDRAGIFCFEIMPPCFSNSSQKTHIYLIVNYNSSAKLLLKREISYSDSERGKTFAHTDGNIPPCHSKVLTYE